MFQPTAHQWHDKRHKYPLPAFGGFIDLLVTAVQVPADTYLYAGRVGASKKI